MPMPKRDTVQRTVRIPTDLSNRIDGLLKDPVTGRTMFGGFSHLVTESIERLLKSHWWKTRLKSLRVQEPDLQLEIRVSVSTAPGKELSELRTLDIYAERQAGTPGSAEQPEVDEMYIISEMLLGDTSVLDLFPEIQRYAERELNTGGGE